MAGRTRAVGPGIPGRPAHHGMVGLLRARRSGPSGGPDATADIRGCDGHRRGRWRPLACWTPRGGSSPASAPRTGAATACASWRPRHPAAHLTSPRNPGPEGVTAVPRGRGDRRAVSPVGRWPSRGRASTDGRRGARTPCGRGRRRRGFVGPSGAAAGASRRSAGCASSSPRITSDEQLIGGAPRCATLLTAICETIERYDPTIVPSVLLLDPVSRTLHSGVGPSLPREYLAASEGLVIGPMIGSCGARPPGFGELAVTRSIAVDPRWEPSRGLAARAGVDSCWSMPVEERRRGGAGHPRLLRAPGP